MATLAHKLAALITDSADVSLIMEQGTITGATTVFTLSVGPPASLSAQGVVPTSGPGVLFGQAVQLQGYAADDIFTVGPLASTETLMGVDGILSAGFVFVQIKQMIALQADSASNAIFDAWWRQMVATKDAWLAQGVVKMTTIQSQWVLINGALTQYHPIPDAKKLLQPRRYEITWQTVQIMPTLS